MAKKKLSKTAQTMKAFKGMERETRRELDPWFGKHRKAGEMGRHKTKAAKSRQACRDRSLWV